MFKSSAVKYAENGFPVFPCNCKIPLTKNGYKDASKEIEKVQKLFSDHPNANIGLVTGKVSGVWVLDIDTKNDAGGLESLEKLEKEYGMLPETLRSITWSGGRHYFFKYPERGMGCKTGIRPGIDIRGDGGYVIVPPSVVEGKSYIWDSLVDVAESPEWLLELLSEKTPTVDLSDQDINVTKTKRNSTLTSFAGGFRRAGLEVDQIMTLLKDINRKRCSPPLSDVEVEKIAKSVGRYSPKSEDKTRVDCNGIASYILERHRLLFCNDIYYEYDGSVYKEVAVDYIKKLIKVKLGQKFSTFSQNEVLNSIRVEISVTSDQLNISPALNLKNGMFDISTGKILSHNPDYNSTIQLPVEYKEDAECPLWIETLVGIFNDKDPEERAECINILQEFFGLCLTREVKYDKALFLLGEGRNGKSTVLYIIESIMGQSNYSAVTLEALIKPNYISEIFGKLANISIETNAKSSIYDAMFKAIVSGDTIAADRKYGHPFKFRPFCKMIFALNNMPQVSDKTDAFFKRLIILKLTRQFNEQDQDKDLKYKIVQKETAGIFLWMIKGYNRLRARGYFDTTLTQVETEEYRKENNSVLEFVGDECIVEPGQLISKKMLYSRYTSWCKEGGLHPLGKSKFGRQIVKHYALDGDSRDSSGTSRIWSGINLVLSDV